MSRATLRTLTVLSVLELATLAVLLINLATVHLRPITQAMGPVHGAVYLSVVVIALLAPGLRPTERALGCLPVIGGILTLWRVRRRGAIAAETQS